MTNDQWGMLWGVKRSIRYHAYRRRFWNNWHVITMVAAVFSAATSIATFGGFVGIADHPWLHPVLMVATATLLVLDAVLGFSSKSALHDMLKRRLVSLERMVERSDGSDEELDFIADERARIEDDEPDVLGVLNDICHNEELTAQGIDEGRLKIGWFQQWMASYIDVKRHRIVPVAS